MSSDWVPFHKRLVKGPKRAIPRELRFVLLELSLESRATRGVLDLSPRCSTLDAVHDLLGGNRQQIEDALAEFCGSEDDEPAIVIERSAKAHRLIIPKWDEWAGPKTGAERMAEMRERERAERAERDARNAVTTKPSPPVTPVTKAPSQVVTSVTPTGQDRTEENTTEHPDAGAGGREVDHGPSEPPSPAAPPLLDVVAKAYAAGIAEAAGAPWSMPDPNFEAPVALDALALHKPQLRGDDIAAWVRRSAATYRRAMAPKAEFQRGFRPTKWLEWLNSGSPNGKTKGPVRGAPVQPDEPGGGMPAWAVKAGLEPTNAEKP